jgi:hypothetical protein
LKVIWINGALITGLAVWYRKAGSSRQAAALRHNAAQFLPVTGLTHESRDYCGLGIWLG